MGAAEELDDVGQGVDGFDGLTARRFGDYGGNDAPEFGVRDIGRGRFKTFGQLGGSTVGAACLTEQTGQAEARMDAGLDLLVDLCFKSLKYKYL